MSHAGGGFGALDGDFLPFSDCCTIVVIKFDFFGVDVHEIVAEGFVLLFAPEDYETVEFELSSEP